MLLRLKLEFERWPGRHPGSQIGSVRLNPDRGLWDTAVAETLLSVRLRCYRNLVKHSTLQLVGDIHLSGSAEREHYISRMGVVYC